MRYLQHFVSSYNLSSFQIHLKQHKEEDEQFKCTVCGFDLKEKTALDEHTKLHTDLPALQCVLCKNEKTFKQKGALVRHMRIHVRFICATAQTFYCIFAGNISDLTKVLIFFFLIYLQSGLHFYQCHRCGKGFVHKSSFEMHLMAHDDIRKKQCPHCTQMFRSTSHLNRHLRIHVSANRSISISWTVHFFGYVGHL